LAEVVETAAGIAIRTQAMTLQEARGAVGSMLRAGQDAPLYPIDD
jgi:hypothetical protein